VLPAYSGGTAPALHRLPFEALTGTRRAKLEFGSRLSYASCVALSTDAPPVPESSRGRTWTKRRHDFDYDCQFQGHPTFQADSDLICRALITLVENAVRYSSKAGGDPRGEHAARSVA
jgi:hypothetical protein